jgi:hypothetical protein
MERIIFKYISLAVSKSDILIDSSGLWQEAGLPGPSIRTSGQRGRK